MALYPEKFNILSICAGIGGLDLGVKLAVPTARTICYIEREAYAASTLVARMEDKTLDDAPIWDDLKTFDGKPWRGKMDCIIAGFPCQPFSVAGAKRGTADARWLWDDVWRIICEIRPDFVFLENVPGLLRGGIERVLGSLAEGGYYAEWDCFSAEQCGFAHKRERWFALAKFWDSKNVIGKRSIGDGNGSGESTKEIRINGCFDENRSISDSKQQGLQGSGSNPTEIREKPGEGSASKLYRTYFLPGYDDIEGWSRVISINPQVEPAVCRAVDGSPRWLVDANTYREDRLRALGNGVIPLTAAVAFKILFWRLTHQK